MDPVISNCVVLIWLVSIWLKMNSLQTDIWLVVRVPVLSEQMTEVQPSVSTEGKLRTMAFFLAIRRVPANDSLVHSYFQLVFTAWTTWSYKSQNSAPQWHATHNAQPHNGCLPTTSTRNLYRLVFRSLGPWILHHSLKLHAIQLFSAA